MAVNLKQTLAYKSNLPDILHSFLAQVFQHGSLGTYK